MSSADLKNLSIKDLKKLVNEEYKQNKKLRQDKKKKKLIQVYKKLQKQNKNLRQEKSKPKQKIKTFDEYFQECIKNKSIPKDTPDYLKKALERAMKEYEIELNMRSQLLKILLKSMSLMESQKYSHLNILQKRLHK